MSKEKKKEAILRIAEKFTGIPEEDKKFVTGYMIGKEEERERWQKNSTPAA